MKNNRLCICLVWVCSGLLSLGFTFPSQAGLWQQDSCPFEEASDEVECGRSQAFDDQALISALQRRNGAGLRQQEKECFELFLPAVKDFSLDTEYETERSIWKFMHDNYSYMQQAETLEDTTPYGLAVNQKGTAQAFARTFHILARAMKLETYYIEGTLLQSNEAWAWNEVRLDGCWYHIDTALDARNDALEYINLTDIQMKGTHSWAEENYPACTATEYHYANAQVLEYLKNGKICSTEEEARDYIEGRIAKSAKKFYVLSEEDLTAAAGEYGSAYLTQITLLDDRVYYVISLSPYYR